MPKNLFTICRDAAGKVLSFLERKESLVYYLMYKTLTRIENFIPEDYYFVISAIDCNMYPISKNIKNLVIDCNMEPSYLKYLHLDNFAHLERLRISGYVYEVKEVQKLVNLKNLDAPSLVMGVNALNNFGNLVKYRGELRVNSEEKERTRLCSFNGHITSRTVQDVYVDKYFDPDILEELEFDFAADRKIYNLSSFINLRKLCVYTPLESISDLKPLINLEELAFIHEGEFDCTILSGMTKLRKLSIKCSSFFNEGQLPNTILQGLTKLCSSGLFEESIRHRLPNMVNLKTLALVRPTCNIIKQLPISLEKLTLNDVVGDMGFFSHIQRLTSLRILEVNFEEGFRSSMMKYVGKLYNLEELIFSGWSCFNSDSLNDLQGLTKLKKIKVLVRKTLITKESFDCLSHLKGLSVEC